MELKGPLKALLILLVGTQTAEAHGYMTVPVPRGGEITGTGTKIIGTGTAVDLTTCVQGQGGISATPTANIIPANTFTPGQQITVTWKTTIPHLNPPGVRIALRYPNVQGDTFASHILQTGLQAGEQGGTTTITLPAQQGRAFLMWSWVSTADGGYYVTCADIVVGQDDDPGGGGGGGGGGGANNNTGGGGNTGNTAGNPNNNQNNANGGGGTSGLTDDSASVIVIVVCCLVILLAIGAVYYYVHYVNSVSGISANNTNNNTNNTASSLPTGRAVAIVATKQQPQQQGLPRIQSMRPKSVAKGLRLSGELPAGWHATVDGDGDTYYYHDNGSTSWEVPMR